MVVREQVQEVRWSRSRTESSGLADSCQRSDGDRRMRCTRMHALARGNQSIRHGRGGETITMGHYIDSNVSSSRKGNANLRLPPRSGSSEARWRPQSVARQLARRGTSDRSECGARRWYPDRHTTCHSTVVGRTVAIRRPRERSRLLALWLPHTYSSFAYVLARVTGRRFTLGGS